MHVIFWTSTSSNMDVISRYIGPYKLKHWLKKYGYQSQVIDFVKYLSGENLYLATKKFITKDTLCIGVSVTFLAAFLVRWRDGRLSPFPEHVIKVAYRIKKEFPHIKFVLGGYGSEHVFGGNIFEDTIMSYTESSEDIFLEYLNYLKHGSEPPLHREVSSYYHVSEDYVKNNDVRPRRHFYQARTKIYNIERDDFKFDQMDAILPKEALPLDISRGCIFACRFCNYPHLGKSKTDYIRGMEYIKEELVYNYENFGTQFYMVLDDTFNETQVKMQAFVDMTKSLPFSIEYSAYLRADLIDRFPDTAYMLSESGLWGAFHGLESLHPYASNLVGKAWSGRKARDYIPRLYHDIWQGRIPMHLNFIMGLPKEDLNYVLDTVNWVRDHKIYNIGYERLGLVNPESSGRFSILSEFDRNATKWGFTFIEGLGSDRTAWVNETWTPLTLTDSYNKVNEHIDNLRLRKATVWNLGNMQMMGYSKEFLTTVPRGHYDMVEFADRRARAYRDYYNLLMSL